MPERGRATVSTDNVERGQMEVTKVRQGGGGGQQRLDKIALKWAREWTRTQQCFPKGGRRKELGTNILYLIFCEHAYITEVEETDGILDLDKAGMH